MSSSKDFPAKSGLTKYDASHHRLPLAELCGGPGNEGEGLIQSDDLHLILPSGCDPPLLGHLFPRTGGGCSAGVGPTYRT